MPALTLLTLLAAAGVAIVLWLRSWREGVEVVEAVHPWGDWPHLSEEMLPARKSGGEGPGKARRQLTGDVRTHHGKAL